METEEKPVDRIIIDLFEDSYQLMHTPGLSLMEVSTLLYLCLQQIEKQAGSLHEEPSMLQ